MTLKTFFVHCVAKELGRNKACCSQPAYTWVANKKPAEFVLTSEVANTQISCDIWEGVESSWPFGLAYQSSSHFVLRISDLCHKMLSVWLTLCVPRLLYGEMFQKPLVPHRFISTNWMSPKLRPSTHDAWNLATGVVRRLDGQGQKKRKKALSTATTVSVVFCVFIQTWVASFPCFQALLVHKQTASDRQLGMRLHFGLLREAPTGFLLSQHVCSLSPTLFGGDLGR